MEKNSSTFEQNYALLMEKWPTLALLMGGGVGTAMRKQKLPRLALKEVDLLYFYGVGQGEIYGHVFDWLKEAPSRRLILIEDDWEGLAAFLHLEEAAKLLQDEQVVFCQLDDLELYIERFPRRSVEVGALPSKRRGKKWREKILQKASYAHALHVDRLHGYQPFQNFVRNLRHLPRSFYANKLEGKFKGIPAVVCGAGPSLKAALPILKTLENRSLLIAGGSTLAALSAQGILPHFGAAVDPNLEEYRRMKNSFAFEVPLLYSTRVFPAVFQTANGPFGYMRSGIGGVPEIWMEEELGLLEPLIGTDLSSDAISVTSICLAWAQFLGCNPILLSGVDLAYTGNQRYAPGVVDEELDLEEAASSADRIVKKKSRSGQPVYTAVRWLMESAAFSDFAKKHRKTTTFLNTTEGGIGFKNIPFCPLEEAVAPLPDLGFSLRAKVHAEIGSVPMPAQTERVIQEKMGEMKKSLENVVGHLEICAQIKPGSIAMAELELMEEMAYPYLFYDALAILEKEGEEPATKWNRFLQLARRYLHMFADFSLS
jgi:hypothetical protein